MIYKNGKIRIKKLCDLAIYIRNDYAQKHVVNPLGVYEIEK